MKYLNKIAGIVLIACACVLSHEIGVSKSHNSMLLDQLESETASPPEIHLYGVLDRAIVSNVRVTMHHGSSISRSVFTQQGINFRSHHDPDVLQPDFPNFEAAWNE